MLTLVYRVVPNRLLPWRAVWPGALPRPVAIGAVDYGFPLYLSNVSTVARVGTSLVLLVIVPLYAFALIILVAAVVNASRYEGASPVDASVTAQRPSRCITSAPGRAATRRARLKLDLALPGGVFLRYAGMALPTQ